MHPPCSWYGASRASLKWGCCCRASDLTENFLKMMHVRTYIHPCLISMYSSYLRGQQQPLCMWMINGMCKKNHIWLLGMSHDLNNFGHSLCPKHISPHTTPFKASWSSGNPSPSLLVSRTWDQDSETQSYNFWLVISLMSCLVWVLVNGHWLYYVLC